MAVNVDNRSARLDLPLPNEQNFLQDDVKRLVDCLSYLDSYVATVANDGKLDPYQLPDNAAKVDAAGIILPAQLPTTVVVLDAKGKIPVKHLPPAGTTNIFEASSQSAMLALAATPGDICKRLDVGESYVLADTDATKVNSWRSLPVNIVKTINGQSGDFNDVAFLTRVGTGNTRTLSNLTGPLRLKAKAADDYDAVTLGELKTVQAIGSSGANISGVMNNFIGAVEWFNGSRASLPAGYIAADGQLESRTDPATADLWAAVDKGILSFATGGDAAWIATPEWRGQYTKGDGSTNFRVPDLNGMLQNGVNGFTGPSSYSAPFLRGSGGATSTGAMQPNMNKEHAHRLYMSAGGTGATVTVVGLDSVGKGSFTNAMSQPGGGSALPHMEESGGSESRPNAVVGIWIIRANGSFQAANTDFQVKTSDTVIPAAGTQVAGGKVTSTYSAAGVEQIQGQMWTEKSVGQADARLVLSAANTALNKRTWMSLDTQGQINTTGSDSDATPNGRVMVDRVHNNNSLDEPALRSGVWYGGDITSTSGGRSKPFNYWMTLQLSEGNGNWAQMFFPMGVDAAPKYRYRINSVPQITDYRTLTIDPASDIRIKKDVQPYDGKKSLANIEALEFKTFRFIEAPDVVRRGVIAQQAETVDAEYVH